LRVEPIGQDGLEGVKGLTDPSEPPPMVLDLFRFVFCQIDGGTVDG